MYRYMFSATGRNGKCPYCGRASALLSMTEEKEESHPLLKFRTWTERGCRTFQAACRPCLENLRHPGAMTA